jgi:hypothetical protein
MQIQSFEIRYISFVSDTPIQYLEFKTREDQIKFAELAKNKNIIGWELSVSQNVVSNANLQK